MAKGEDIQARMIDFGIRIVTVCGCLPRNHKGRHFAQQLLRSGTAPAARYAEARGAESRKDFIHKLKICLKELNESQIWLRMIIGSGLLQSQNLHPILNECLELSRIINASINTAKSKIDH